MGKNIIQNGQVSLVGKDDKTFPITQIQAYGQAADVLVINPYGMHTNPPVDSYTITFSVNGQQENRAAICYKPDLRQKELKEGEAIFGNFVIGSTVFYDEDGNIIINCEKDQIVTIKGDATIDISGDANISVGGETNLTSVGDVTITAPKLKINGDLEVTGSTTLSSTVTSGGTNISDTHKHAGSATAPTGAISNTGDPV